MIREISNAKGPGLREKHMNILMIVREVLKKGPKLNAAKKMLEFFLSEQILNQLFKNLEANPESEENSHTILKTSA